MEVNRIEVFDKWLLEVSGREWSWYIKRLAANDTLATGSHQAGPYLPNPVVFDLFPTIKKSNAPNPDAKILCQLASHNEKEREVRVVWYNQKTRNECHMTRWGGNQSPVLDPEATGSICIFAFHREASGDADYCKAWLCNMLDEDFFVDRIGPVEPGIPLFFKNGKLISNEIDNNCWLTETEMPSCWLKDFPSGAEIVEKTMQMRRLFGKFPDERLLMRRDCEFNVFKSIEKLFVLPRIKQGFSTVDEFIDYSNSITNRRKSRAGKSLELHLKSIFDEEAVRYSHGAISEGNKKPDFLFPSIEAYKKSKQPLHMLAAKTTCKDRWRQIISEADKIPEKHLITLQEGISVNQFNEMKDEGVVLVVPEALHKKYPKEIRGDLLSLNQFIQIIKN